MWTIGNSVCGNDLVDTQPPGAGDYDAVGAGVVERVDANNQLHFRTPPADDGELQFAPQIHNEESRILPGQPGENPRFIIVALSFAKD